MSYLPLDSPKSNSVQVLYGEEEEEMMAESPDPVIQRIWQEKEVNKREIQRQRKKKRPREV